MACLDGLRRVSIADEIPAHAFASFVRSHTEWTVSDGDIEILYSLTQRSIGLVHSDGTVVGSVFAVDNDTFSFIAYVVVHTEFRRRGLARHLMKTMLEQLRADGQRETLLLASPLGAPLYVDLGYTQMPHHGTLYVRPKPMKSPAGQIDGQQAEAESIVASVPVVDRDADVETGLEALAKYSGGSTRDVRSRLIRTMVRDHGSMCVSTADNSTWCWGRPTQNGSLFVGPLCAPSVEAAEAVLKGLVKRWVSTDGVEGSAEACTMGRIPEDGVARLALEASGFKLAFTIPFFSRAEEGEATGASTFLDSMASGYILQAGWECP